MAYSSPVAFLECLQPQLVATEQFNTKTQSSDRQLYGPFCASTLLCHPLHDSRGGPGVEGAGAGGGGGENRFEGVGLQVAYKLVRHRKFVVGLLR